MESQSPVWPIAADSAEQASVAPLQTFVGAVGAPRRSTPPGEVAADRLWPRNTRGATSPRAPLGSCGTAEGAERIFYVGRMVSKRFGIAPGLVTVSHSHSSRIRLSDSTKLMRRCLLDLIGPIGPKAAACQKVRAQHHQCCAPTRCRFAGSCSQLTEIFAGRCSHPICRMMQPPARGA